MNFQVLQKVGKKYSKVKQFLYMPWKRLRGEEV
jgi:hypothetical protein